MMLKRVSAFIILIFVFAGTLFTVSADTSSVLDDFEWALEQADNLQYYDPEIMVMSVDGSSAYPQYKSNDSGSTFTVSVKNTYGVSGAHIQSWKVKADSSSVTYTDSLNSSASFVAYSVGYNQTFDSGELNASISFSSTVPVGKKYSALFVFTGLSSKTYSLSDFALDIYTSYGYVSLFDNVDVSFFQLNSTNYCILVSCEDNQFEFSTLRCTYLGNKESSSSVLGFPVAQLNLYSSDTLSILQDIYSAVNNLPADIYLKFTENLSSIISKLNITNSRLLSLVTAVDNLPSDIYSHFESSLSNIYSKLNQFVSVDFPAFGNKIYSYFENLPNRIAESVNGIGSDKENIENDEQVSSVDTATEQFNNAISVDTDKATAALSFSSNDLSKLTVGSNFISTLLNDFMTKVPEVYLLCLFSLTIGLCCYVLGRKLS